MSHAVMPLSDYVGACDVIREKTGGTEPIKSGELVEQIGAVHTAGKLAALESAEVLQGKLFGNPVTATALTPIEHNTEARLESKNLFDKDNVKVVYSNVSSLYEFEPTETGIKICFHSPGSPFIGAKIGDYDEFIGKTLCFSMGYVGDLPIVSTGIWVRANGTNTQIGESFGNKSYAYATIPDTYKGQDGVLFIRLCTSGLTDETKDTWLDFSNMQLEYNSTATPYTPYVSDFTKVRTRNLFDKDAALDGYEITSSANGTIGENANWFVSDYIPVIDGEKYSISGKENGTVVCAYDSNKNFIASLEGSSANSFTVHKGRGVSFVRVNGLMTQKDTCQIEHGSTATPYVPYTIPAVVKKRGKNLIPYPYTDTTKTVNGVTFTDNGDGTITIEGAPSGVAEFLLGNIELPHGRYFLYHGAEQLWGSGHSYIRLAYRKDGVTVDSTTMYCNWESDPPNSNRYFDTTTKDYDTALIHFVVLAATPEFPAILHRPQLEVGSVATEFEKGSPVITYPADAEGNLGEVTSISPTMILECPDVEGVNIVAHYLKDIDGAFEERLAELEAAVVENA